ncbi:MAG: 3-dehydroquinate synthase [Bacteroidota bacterium]
MIERLVKLHFRPEATAAFEAIFAESRDKIRAQAGCIHLEGWRAIDNPNCYFTYSRWLDEESLNAYRQSDLFRGVWPRTKALFSAKPEAISAKRLSELAPPAAGHQRMVLDDYHLDFGPLASTQIDWLKSCDYTAWVVIADELTEKYCWPRLLPLLEGHPTYLITVPAGERHKHLDTTRFIWEELFRLKAGRRWCVLNLGGGVIGDMGGFAASTFKRGIDFIQLPTTLLSQVDASVGGKLGVDFYELKNSIGVFRNPRAVWIDPAFLATLPARELRSGYAEVIKHALIADHDQWQRLQQLTDLGQADWSAIIPASVNIKYQIVQQDPMEQGLRKVLNFGHTIGHAIESYWLSTEQRLLHGEAIAAGMIMEAWLSTQISGLPAADLAEISQYLLHIYGHQSVPVAALEDLLDLMRQDKKNEDERINFSLLSTAGSCLVNQTADAELIRQSIEYYNKLG